MTCGERAIKAAEHRFDVDNLNQPDAIYIYINKLLFSAAAHAQEGPRASNCGIEAAKMEDKNI